MEKTVGVLGGMGPEATAIFFRQLISLTPATIDQDHLQIVVINNPKIPDRNDFLKGSGTSPLPLLCETARRIEKAGADFIAVPCNTAHCFWTQLQAAVEIPVLHIMEETALHVSRHLMVSEPREDLSIGLLATPATCESGLYQQRCEEKGIRVLLPDPQQQRTVHQCIQRIKASRTDSVAEELAATVEYLSDRGAKAIILGCTELGLVPFKSRIPLFDSLLILAQATLRHALEGSSSI